MLPSSVLRFSGMIGTSARFLSNVTPPASRTCARLISTTVPTPSRESIKSPQVDKRMKKEGMERRMDGAGYVVDVDAIAEEIDGGGEGSFQRFPDDDVYHATFNGVKVAAQWTLPGVRVDIEALFRAETMVIQKKV